MGTRKFGDDGNVLKLFYVMVIQLGKFTTNKSLNCILEMGELCDILQIMI